MKSVIFEYLTKSFGDLIQYRNNERLWWRDSENQYMIEYIISEKKLWVDLDFTDGFYAFFDLTHEDGERYLMQWAEKYLDLPDIKCFDNLPF